MSEDLIEQIPQLSISSFFRPYIDIHKLSKDHEIQNKKYLLPFLADLFDEKEFAKVHLGWNENGLSLFINVKEKITAINNDAHKSDSIEIFIDTRDNKTVSYITKYCHHFIFYPKDAPPKEETRFRADDIHTLCDPNDLKVTTEILKSSYTMRIMIPQNCLYGFEQHGLGFTYRINRAEKAPQHFSVTSKEYPIERRPLFWASINLRE